MPLLTEQREYNDKIVHIQLGAIFRVGCKYRWNYRWCKQMIVRRTGMSETQAHYHARNWTETWGYCARVYHDPVFNPEGRLGTLCP